MDYKKMTIDDIIAWCQVNNQVAWLKAKAAEEVIVKQYPRVKNEAGKMVADKTAAPTLVKAPITFIQIKKAFCEKFMPEIMPKAKAKKEDMYTRIKNL
jgi:hypothetical protein